MNASKTILATLAIAAAVAPLTAGADVPGETQLKGHVTAFDGRFDLHVQAKNGDVSDVVLHPGTIINPTGLTLRPGMTVTILGRSEGARLDANEIDTPYHADRRFVYGPDVSGAPFYGPAYTGAFFGPAFYGPGFYGGGPFFGVGF